MSEFAPFTIMAKPVSGRCNLDCQYCYYLRKPQELYPRETHFLMGEDLLESYTRQYLQAMPHRCDFNWQGGEPMLAGKEFYRKALAFQKQYAAPETQIANAFQTNGTLLDDEWCEMFAENHFLIGISLDGSPQWHDSFRRDAAGNPSFDRAWAGLELLRKHKVEYNVLVTLHSANASHAGDIYRYFVNRGVQYLQFIPILEDGPDGQIAPFSCTGRQWGKFLCEVFDIWASKDMGKVSERFIDNILHTLIFGHGSTCCYCQRCANAYVLEYNGDLYACDHFVQPQWRIGNLRERPLADLLRDPLVERFAQLKTRLPAACAECPYVQICRGGCPKHHRPIGTSPERVNHFCEGYKMFFAHALPVLIEMAPYFQAGQIPPFIIPDDAPKSAKAAKPAADKSENSRGRNAPCPCGSGRKFKQCCGRDK